MKTLVLVGNHEVCFSSESHYAWTFENKLGWKVIRIQENKTSAAEVIRQCDNADALFWVHTHSWSFPDEKELISENIKIPSFSFHLDRYWGIGSREGAYLQHPSFHLDAFFSADGGNNERWQQANVPHHWLLPGVVEYGAYLGNAKENIDVLFTGARCYHGEYNFRPRLIDALQANYGDRFQVRQGVREEALNDLYASAKICVGDHIFAGCPRYCSDRLFETIGRGGFIIYPETEGVTDQIPGLVIYAPQDADDLVHKIDYYLDKAHEAERIERRNAAFEYVKKNGTYTNRLQEILRVMELA